MFESIPTPSTAPASHQAQHAQHAHHSGGSFGKVALAVIVSLAISGGVAYSFLPKPPTAEEVLATLAPDEANVRKTYAEMIKQGKVEDAKVYAKGVAVTRAESKQAPILFATTAAEAMQEEPSPQPANAETDKSGNV